MITTNQAIRAYRGAMRCRSQREQEADIFRQISSALKQAATLSEIQRVKIIADNRRLWMATTDLMRDPASALPDALRASIISVGLAVQRELREAEPDLEFLAKVNELIADGLASQSL